MKITYADLLEITKDKKIIGIGENTHGTQCFWTYRKKLIHLLRKRNSVIALEENNEYLHNNIEDRFPMHQTRVFEKFRKEIDMPIIGVDNYLGESSQVRSRRMSEEIIKLTKKYERVFFLAFNSHVSTFIAPKNFELDFRGYDSKREVGYYLKDHSYFNIGLILLQGKTLAKELGEYEYKTMTFKNLPEIRKLSSGIYYTDKNYKYSGMGPFLYKKYETKWHDAFIIIPKCNVVSL